MAVRETQYKSLRNVEGTSLGATDLSASLLYLEDDKTDPPRDCAKAHRGQAGDLGLQKGKVLSDQPNGLLKKSNCISGQGKSYGCSLSALL